MRISSSVFVCFVVAVVLVQAGQAQGGKIKMHNWPQRLEELKVKDKIGEVPATLAEAHAELERMLSPEGLAKIDAMTSERQMHKEHFFGLGGDLLTGWKLEGGSVLAQHMEELGFAYASDMAYAIVDTFWCKRHGQDYRLGERATESRRQWETDEKAQEEYDKRVREGRAALRSGMMGLHFEAQDVPTASIPIREHGVRARSLCRLRDGVFLTAYRQGSMRRAKVPIPRRNVAPNDGLRLAWPYDHPIYRGYGIGWREDFSTKPRKMKAEEEFYTPAYYFDPADRQIHRIDVPEVNEVYRAVVAGERAWFGGVTDGKYVVAGVGAENRITVPLPQSDEMPDLGRDGASLLGVYAKTIYRLEGRTWTVLHSGDILLPRSGLPPLRYGDKVFFLDEAYMLGRQTDRLWWLTIGESLYPRALDQDVGVLAAGGPEWDEVNSYCVTSEGDLWACVNEWYSNCLLRRAQDGDYSIATLAGSVRFMEGWPETRIESEGAYISAVTALPDGTLLLASRTGIYRLQGDTLKLELRFTLDKPLEELRDKTVSRVVWRREGDKMVKENVEVVVQKASERGRKVVDHVTWNPNTVLQLADGSYFLGTDTWEGAYWIRPDDDDQWTCLPAAEGDPVVW